MNQNRQRPTSAEIRGRLDHPVIDSDGHMIEFVPAIIDQLRQVGGPELTERYIGFLKGGPAHSFRIRDDGTAVGWHGLTPAERHEKRITRPSFWIFPAKNTRDRATAMLPALLRERLDEFGIDFCIVYPTLGVHLMRHPDEELRRAGCRSINILNSELFRDHADRMTPAACIPMHTPVEARDELSYAVEELGLKVVMISGAVNRPVSEVATRAPELTRHGFWIDTLGLESAYDYDPVWAKCVELKVAATAHNGSMGWGARSSTANFTYNHIGHFAAAGEAFCKALVLGGARQRFPTLNFAFLEGGAGWGSDLYGRLVEHWERRNRRIMEATLDPATVDSELLVPLFQRYGGKLADSYLDEVSVNAGMRYEPHEAPADIDDWSSLDIEKPEDIRDLFVPNFYFGCEADDRMTAVAFDPRMNPFGARLKAIFGSDIGHFDVDDMTGVLAEAHELVDDGLLTDDDFRDFTFANAATLHAGMNPDFFNGTVVEDAVNKLLAERVTSPVG